MNKKIKIIERNDIVQFNYFGYYENGFIFDNPEKPITCKLGTKQLLNKFEKNLLGMKIGEKKVFSIPPEEAYGLYDEHLIIEVPLKKFPNIHPHVGMKITLPLEKIEKKYPMEIVGVNNLTVTLDANHPLAGKTLFYEVEILNIKKN